MLERLCKRQFAKCQIVKSQKTALKTRLFAKQKKFLLKGVLRVQGVFMRNCKEKVGPGLFQDVRKNWF